MIGQYNDFKKWKKNNDNIKKKEGNAVRRENGAPVWNTNTDCDFN